MLSSLLSVIIADEIFTMTGVFMVTLNDYLYSGDTVLKILHRYSSDLKNEANEENNSIDMAHSDFLVQIIELLEHTDFLTSQSQRIKEFYIYMTQKYPFLAFTFKGRIKSLVRAEEKFNRYVLDYIYNYHKQNNAYPSEEQIRDNINCFRDLIAYRIVISLPLCHVENESELEEKELKYLYEIANSMPGFLEQRGFTPELSGLAETKRSDVLDSGISAYYRDYIRTPRPMGYRSLHITFFDNIAKCFTEVQLRTKAMDDHAKIGDANHFGYEKSQKENLNARDIIPQGECRFFDEAYERLIRLKELDLTSIKVNMFTAFSNQLINDGCGLFVGRQILPFEHLSRFQNDMTV